ncbi:MAG: HWE histidine kinase domain-containing protein [Pseudomonadota bacterium]
MMRSDGAPPADLTACDREPIHLLGRVQDYGCLIAVTQDWVIAHASANCHTVLGVDVAAMVGRPLAQMLPPHALHDLRAQLQVLFDPDQVARMIGYALFGDERRFDLCLHMSGDHVVLECERSADPAARTSDTATVQGMIAQVGRAPDRAKMIQSGARALAALSGFDRVMVYQFEADGSGTVVAEVAPPDMTPFLGLRYPASDIPQQARALYLRSPLRIIADVDGPTHAITGPADAALDLSLAATRAVSPVHLDYLRNMGVAASMSVSIIVQGQLWGLFACHHRSAHYVDFHRRSAIELFGQLFSYEVSQQLMRRDVDAANASRAVQDRLRATLSGGAGLRDAFETLKDDIHAVIPFDGAAIYAAGAYTAWGHAPNAEAFGDVAQALRQAADGRVYATQALRDVHPAADRFADQAVGALMLPLSDGPGDYVALFRQEVIHTVTWAGDPRKPVTQDAQQLTPRRSFAAWQETVRGQSAPWTDTEQAAAEALHSILASQPAGPSTRSQSQQEVLIAELNHRVRNILTLIRGLVSQADNAAATVEAFRDVLDDRLEALARAHDQLTETHWTWAPLRHLVDTEVHVAPGRVHISGPDIELSPTAFTTAALVVHELMTNAVKYGALSVPDGEITFDVKALPDGGARLRWTERGGPPAAPPHRRGFGTTLIEQSIPFELNGTAQVHYSKAGLHANFTLPAAHVRAGGHRAEAADTLEGADAALGGHAIVLEDNMIIALDAARILSDLGARHVHTVRNVADAISRLQQGKVGFALADVQLGSDTSAAFVAACLDARVPVMLATGYGPSAGMRAAFPDVPVIAKPFTARSIQAALPAARACVR